MNAGGGGGIAEQDAGKGLFLTIRVPANDKANVVQRQITPPDGGHRSPAEFRTLPAAWTIADVTLLLAIPPGAAAAPIIPVCAPQPMDICTAAVAHNESGYARAQGLVSTHSPFSGCSSNPAGASPHIPAAGSS